MEIIAVCSRKLSKSLRRYVKLVEHPNFYPLKIAVIDDNEILLNVLHEYGLSLKHYSILKKLNLVKEIKVNTVTKDIEILSQKHLVKLRRSKRNIVVCLSRKGEKTLKRIQLKVNRIINLVNNLKSS
ncbi:MAG: hypothetical protein DRJ52_09390 [Thermoprotei archaeon]|nr:MAG: hypothetical protein DRJ52_09390 [Thermoprotei archaeon]